MPVVTTVRLVLATVLVGSAADNNDINDNINDNIHGGANDDNDYDYDDGDTYNMRTRTTTTTSARVQQRRPVRSPSRVGTGRHHNPAAAEHLLSLVILGYSFSELDSSAFVV